MGCFLACFGGSKSRKGRSPIHKNLSRNTNNARRESQIPPCSLIVPIESPTEEIQRISILDPREKAGQTESLDDLKPRPEKKVSFDLQVKTYSEIPPEDVPNFLPEKESADYEIEEKECRKSTTTRGNSTVGLLPASYRYQNCRDSDEEDADDPTDVDGYDVDEDEEDEDDDSNMDVERDVLFEWYSSSIESEATGVSPPSIKKEAHAAKQKPTMGVEYARDRSPYVHTVLNSVANVSEWKSLKSRDPKNPPLLKERKENIPFNVEGLIKSNTDPRREMFVDASLSNWLIPSQTVTGAYSSISDADFCKKLKGGKTREVFGALTNEQINRTPPQRSPCRSPGRNLDKTLFMDDFLSKFSIDIEGIPNTTSKYREDRRVNWHSTPFEVRLERALCKGSAKAYSSFPPCVHQESR